jgi:hypothetical protein
MTRGPSADRPYTEKEIRAILQRAGKLQEARTSGGISSGGTTLVQLQQAASELGLDPELIAQAAREVETEDTATKSSWLLGGPWKVDYDQILPGTVTEENWPFIVDELRAASGRVGTPKTIGKGFEWLSKQPDPLHITFTPHGANTRVRLTARFDEWGVLFYILPSIFVVVFVMLAVILHTAFAKSGGMSPGLFVTLLAGIPALTFLGGRAGFGKLCARKRIQTQNLFEHLKRALNQSAQQALEAAPQTIETQPARLVTSYTASSQPSEDPLLIAQDNRNSG